MKKAAVSFNFKQHFFSKNRGFLSSTKYAKMLAFQARKQ